MTTLPMSPPPALTTWCRRQSRDLESATTCRPRRKASRLDFLPQGQQVTTGRLRPLDERVNWRESGGRQRVAHGDDPRRVRRVRKKAGDGGLSARPFSRGGSAVRVEVEHLPFGPEPIEARRVAGCLPFREHLGESLEAIVCRHQLALAFLCGQELCEGEPQVAARATQRFIRAIRARVYQRGRGLHLKAAPPCDRQQLPHHREVFGDAGHGFAVQCDAWVRPASSREDIGACHLDAGTNGSHARTGLRQPRQHLRLGEWQQLGAGTRRQNDRRERGAQNHHAHNTSNERRTRQTTDEPSGQARRERREGRGVRKNGWAVHEPGLTR